MGKPVDFTLPENKSLTKQSMAEETDINQIVARLRKGIPITHLGRGEPRWGDFFHSTDLLEAHIAVTSMQQQFDRLPASTRTRMENDPVVLLQFMENPENRAEAIKLGLFEPDSEEDPNYPPTGKERTVEPKKEPDQVEDPPTV